MKKPINSSPKELLLSKAMGMEGKVKAFIVGQVKIGLTNIIALYLWLLMLSGL